MQNAHMCRPACTPAYCALRIPPCHCQWPYPGFRIRKDIIWTHVFFDKTTRHVSDCNLSVGPFRQKGDVSKCLNVLPCAEAWLRHHPSYQIPGLRIRKDIWIWARCPCGQNDPKFKLQSLQCRVIFPTRTVCPIVPEAEACTSTPVPQLLMGKRAKVPKEKDKFPIFYTCISTLSQCDGEIYDAASSKMWNFAGAFTH